MRALGQASLAAPPPAPRAFPGVVSKRSSSHGAAAPARLARRGPWSQRNASRGATLEIYTPSLQWRRGPPEWGRPAVPPAEGLVEGGARYRQALGHAIHGRQSPSRVRARICAAEETPHEDVLQTEKAGGWHLEGIEGAGDGCEGPLRAMAARGQRAAYLGEPAADGRCRVAPPHPAAHLLLPSQPAAAGSGCSPRRPIRYGDGGGRARYRG